MLRLAHMYCKALLQHKTAAYYWRLVLQHTTATHYCNTLLQHTTYLYTPHICAHHTSVHATHLYTFGHTSVHTTHLYTVTPAHEMMEEIMKDAEIQHTSKIMEVVEIRTHLIAIRLIYVRHDSFMRGVTRACAAHGETRITECDVCYVSSQHMCAVSQVIRVSGETQITEYVET